MELWERKVDCDAGPPNRERPAEAFSGCRTSRRSSVCLVLQQKIHIFCNRSAAVRSTILEKISSWLKRSPLGCEAHTRNASVAFFRSAIFGASRAVPVAVYSCRDAGAGNIQTYFLRGMSSILANIVALPVFKHVASCNVPVPVPHRLCRYHSYSSCAGNARIVAPVVPRGAAFCIFRDSYR